MTSSVWYVCKYVGIPEARKGGTRAFMLMREMARAGHRAVMITSDSNHLTDPPVFDGRRFTRQIDGVEIHWLKTSKFVGAKSFRRILSWLHFEWNLFRLPLDELRRPDAIIVSSLSLLTIFNGLRLRRHFKCRLVFEVRDIWPLTIIEEGGFSPHNPFVMGLRWIEKLAYRTSDAIVGTMPNLIQHVRESISSPPPVHCIPMGISPDMIENVVPPGDEWVDRYVPKDKFLICHAGTIGITNALDTLFACAREMRDESDVHFLIVGEGDLRPHYEKLCRDLPNVTFTGPVPKDTVQPVLELCDLVYFSVHRSKVWNYGLSLNKVIDYMLVGKPVVASYSGYPTMVEEAGAGSSAPAGDAAALRAEILRLKAMPRDELAAMGLRGKSWILQNRGYDRLAAQYLDLALPKGVKRETHS